MKRPALVIAAAVAALVVVLGLLVPSSPELGGWDPPATTYSPGPAGSKALYLLLRQLELEADRLKQPDYWMLSKDTVLWVLAGKPLARSDRLSLLHFVQNGGTLVAPARTLVPLFEDMSLTPHTLELPGSVTTVWENELVLEHPAVALEGLEPRETYASAADGSPVVAAYALGKGRVVSLGIVEITRNDRIGVGANGIFLARLALDLGDAHRFDEFQTGFGDPGMLSYLANVPYRWALAQLALVGAVGLCAFARRRLPAEPPPRLRRRRTLEHVEAVARLWRQSRDAGLPLNAILDSVADRARHRPGGAASAEPFLGWIECVRPELAPRAREAWERARRLCEQEHPSVSDARRAAEELRQLEREATTW